MSYQIFLPRQVIRSVIIIINKHGTYELPNDLPNDLKRGN